ncbi:MAG TPA: FliG C-terminal domain-containing protein [Candidatus Rifleibacterium sp.]|nr:FliG C-terminal domain-containing protein [Candidatus Rifleibacterium sp.]HPT45289.1 FliG C-terminal domain-containing protein [Candidatus Rifleibacterium sp.]
MAKTQLGSVTGLEILANIMRHCDSKTNRNIITGLSKAAPQVVPELRKKILLFDDLAYADQRGVQRLLKLIRTRDLAVSLKGAPAAVLKNLANNMSQNGLSDLKNEITRIGPAREADVDAARERIMGVVAELMNNKEMFINRPNDGMLI